MPAQSDAKDQCSLLLLLATPAEEDGLIAEAKDRGLPCEHIKKRDSRLGEDFFWLGPVGNESAVIAMKPIRNAGKLAMGSIGFFGTASRAIRLRVATGAQGIVQLGMAFGINARRQKLGDVLVSTCIIPYDNRDVRPDGRWSWRRLVCDGCFNVDYSRASREFARPALVELFRREQNRRRHPFGVHLGAMLSGAARIHCGRFRDELAAHAPVGEESIVGGEMEGVGLVAASVRQDDPIWCVVKGISDFADENRGVVIEEGRQRACRNAAAFLLSALQNDAKG